MARFGAAATLCVGLANCNSTGGRIDPKYGVSASERVVEAGQPVPKGGGTYRVGKPYTVAGRVYVPEENPNYKAEGIASWYGDEFHGRKTANGEIFDMTSITAAHPTLPIPSYVRVTNLRNKRSLIVRVNDRGPYANDRVIDLSVRAAKLLEFHGHGLARVRVEYVGKAPLSGSDDTKLAGTLRENGKPLDGRATAVAVASPKSFNRDYFDATPVSERSGAQPSSRAERPQMAALAPNAPSLDAEPDEVPETLAQPAMAQPAMAQPVSSRAPMLASASSRPEPSPPTPEQLAPRSLGTLSVSGSSPVSAYAAPRYDGSAGVVSGRGLY
jgi:rare lipoprotein A